jgi:hypothetical protein
LRACSESWGQPPPACCEIAESATESGASADRSRGCIVPERHLGSPIIGSAIPPHGFLVLQRRRSKCHPWETVTLSSTCGIASGGVRWRVANYDCPADWLVCAILTGGEVNGFSMIREVPAGGRAHRGLAPQEHHLDGPVQHRPALVRQEGHRAGSGTDGEQGVGQ